MKATSPFPVLYILMRTDLESMNPGKGMAQASHASNAFVSRMNSRNKANPDSDRTKLFHSWQDETAQNFGTVLVLGSTIDQIHNITDVATRLNFDSDIIVDPTYPIRDGEVTHFIELETCGYIFGDKNDPVLTSLVCNLKLHP